MKLEVCIRANNPFRQPLLTAMTDLVPGKQDNTTATVQYDTDHFTVRIFVETEAPDQILQKIAQTVADIETDTPEAPAIELDIRDTDNSEQPLGTGENAECHTVAGFNIIPYNCRLQTPAAPYDILLDPAQAFGTGLHPSTCLCLQLLRQSVAPDTSWHDKPRSVLDIGCGSGILTIAALRLGAAEALGIEINPGAVAAARRNIQINGLAHMAQVAETSWQNVTAHYDLVLANLVPAVLFKAAPHMTQILKQQGLLITSGFRAAKKREVSELFQRYGLRLIKASSCDGWGALLLINHQKDWNSSVARKSRGR